MTLVVLVAAAAAITYLSRAVSLALLPSPQGQPLAVIERVPAPLFAGLAIYTLLGDELSTPAVPVLLAAVAALALTPRRSLAAILAAGLTAYLAATLLL